MTRRVEDVVWAKRFTNGDWTVRVSDGGYRFDGPYGFKAVYSGKSAEYIDELILGYRYSLWGLHVADALPVKMRMPKKLVRDVERYVRANYVWDD
jgi:hypothetical protein